MVATRMAVTVLAVAALAAATLAACGGPAAPPTSDSGLTPAYNRETGRRELITSDRDGDGRVVTWAYMDGPRLDRIEIDRDGDGIADRLEYYTTSRLEAADTTLADAVIARAEEVRPPPVVLQKYQKAPPGQKPPARTPDWIVTRHELYEGGVLRHVEEDTDADGRMNRWETYEGGVLARMDLDLTGRGTPDRRLTYVRGGARRIEVDPDGDGVFVPAPPSGQPPAGQPQ
jgi:hypothetical protein